MSIVDSFKKKIGIPDNSDLLKKIDDQSKEIERLKSQIKVLENKLANSPITSVKDEAHGKISSVVLSNPSPEPVPQAPFLSNQAKPVESKEKVQKTCNVIFPSDAKNKNILGKLELLESGEFKYEGLPSHAFSTEQSEFLNRFSSPAFCPEFCSEELKEFLNSDNPELHAGRRRGDITNNHLDYYLNLEKGKEAIKKSEEKEKELEAKEKKDPSKAKIKFYFQHPYRPPSTPYLCDLILRESGFIEAIILNEPELYQTISSREFKFLKNLASVPKKCPSKLKTLIEDNLSKNPDNKAFTFNYEDNLLEGL